MELKEMLVVIPHSGIIIPHEIPLDSLSNDFPRLMRNVDWYTNWLYDFRDILNNSNLVFPYCSLVLEANRHPEDLDSSVPLRDSMGELVYQPDREPSMTLRKSISTRYLKKFHQTIAGEVRLGKTFMLDAHSTTTARGVTENQIELMNFQVSPLDGSRKIFCPDVFIETYAAELTKRLPGVKITVNESRYHNVYGHVCGEHSSDSMTRAGSRVPAILQETNQKLYMNSDQTPNLEAIETLRRTFANALYHMMKSVSRA